MYEKGEDEKTVAFQISLFLKWSQFSKIRGAVWILTLRVQSIRFPPEKYLLNLPKKLPLLIENQLKMAHRLQLELGKVMKKDFPCCSTLLK